MLKLLFNTNCVKHGEFSNIVYSRLIDLMWQTWNLASILMLFIRELVVYHKIWGFDSIHYHNIWLCIISKGGLCIRWQFWVWAFHKLRNDTLFIEIDQCNQVIINEILMEIFTIFFSCCWMCLLCMCFLEKRKSCRKVDPVERIWMQNKWRTLTNVCEIIHYKK